VRIRLGLLVGATTSLVLVAFLVPLALLVRATVADRAITAGVLQAQGLAPLVATLDSPTLAVVVDRTNAQGRYPVTVFLPDGTLVGAPAARSPTVASAFTGRSITAELDGGREIVVSVAGLPAGTAVIRTQVTAAQLRAGVDRAWLVLVLLGLGLLVVSVVVADLLARAITRPLAAAAGVSFRLARGDLAARAADRGPGEVRQVATGLNLLASRISELLAQERAAAADLSHRLRTPLTALRIDVESLTAGPTRSRLKADLDAVDRTVDHVIREAERPVREGVAAACDAAEVVAERVAFWSVLAEEEGRRMAVAIAPGPVDVRLNRDDLSVCVDALIGNVFAHTPEGVDFGVRLVARRGGGCRLEVGDDGPGMPGGVLDRGSSGGGSTGLGLDIVARAAARSGGSMTLGTSRSGGVAVLVDLGAPR
jgi:signal transduction histidine kinase